MNMAALHSISVGTFQLYRVAIGVSGLLLMALAVRGFGASPHARVLTGAVGAGLIGYCGYLWIGFRTGFVYEVYPWIFIGPVLVVGYHFYTRTTDREAQALAQADFDQERAARRAARASADDEPTP